MANAVSIGGSELGKLLIVGASGYVGRELAGAAANFFDVFRTSRDGKTDVLALDLALPDNFSFANFGEDDLCIFSAAISSPDVCFSDYQAARKINIDGTVYVIERLLERGCRVIFLSTDGVYGNQFDYCDEHTYCTPIGAYAQMKYEVERRFYNSRLFKSVRLSYVFSREDRFTSYLFQCALSHKSAEIFHPFYRSVVFRGDVVEGLLRLARCFDEIADPVINFAGPFCVSRYDFVSAVSKLCNSVLGVTVIRPPENFFEQRANVIAMRSVIFPGLLGRQPVGLVEGLAFADSYQVIQRS